MRLSLRGLFATAFPIAEILTVLILGNLIAGIGLKLLGPSLGFDPALLDGEPATLAADWLASARMVAISLAFRFGVLLLLAYAVARWIHGWTLQKMAVGRGGHSMMRLLAAGLLLFAVAEVPFRMAFLLDAVFDIGAGLEGWRMWAGIPLTTDYLVYVLAAQVLLPPLFEEPLTRGYMRVRFEPGHGPLGAAVMTGVLFMGAHGLFYVADGLVVSAFVAKIFAAILWGWVTYRLQSVIPAILAHALGNLPLPTVWPVQSAALVVMAAIVWVGRSTLCSEARVLVGAWRDVDVPRLGLGLLGVALVMGSLVLVPAALPVVGIVALILTLVSRLPATRRWLRASEGDPEATID